MCGLGGKTSAKPPVSRIRAQPGRWVRHGAAHALHAATKDVVKVQEFLGHSSLATTGIYLQSLTDTRGDDGDLLGERVEP